MEYMWKYIIETIILSIITIGALIIYKDGEEVERLAESAATASAVEEMVKKYA